MIEKVPVGGTSFGVPIIQPKNTSVTPEESKAFVDMLMARRAAPIPRVDNCRNKECRWGAMGKNGGRYCCAPNRKARRLAGCRMGKWMEEDVGKVQELLTFEARKKALQEQAQQEQEGVFEEVDLTK